VSLKIYLCLILIEPKFFIKFVEAFHEVFHEAIE